MSDTEQELLLCLQQLFRPHSSSVANNQHQLSHLLERAETWLPLMNIVASSSYPVDVRYFCANMLYSKVRRHLQQLAAGERAQLQSFLEYSISLDLAAAVPDDGSHKVLIDRLILSLVSLSLRSPGTATATAGEGAARGGVSRVLDLALRILCDPQQPRESLALRILLAIPGELDAADMSKPQREECERDLQAAASAVSVSGSSLSLFHLLEAVCVSPGADQVSASACKRTVLAISTVRAWLPLTGIGLGRLYSSHRALFEFVCSFDSPCYRGDVLKELCQTVQDILEVREYPESQELRLEALSALCDNLSSVHGGHLLQRYFSAGLRGAGEEGDVSAALTAAAASALEVDLPSLLLCRRETSARMLQFLLSCCARPPRNLAFLTFDVWTAVQDNYFDCGDDAAVQGLIREAVAGLAATLTCLLTYPAAADEEEFADLAQLRDPRLGVAELLAGCCSVLGGDFFSSCAAMMQRSAALPQDKEQQWRGTEVVLFVLSSSMTAIKDLLTGGGQATSGAASSAAAEELLRAVCGYLLGSLAPTLLSTQHDAADQHRLAASASRFLGSITFLLVVGQRARGSGQGQGRAGCLADMFPAALEFLVAIMRSPAADCRQASVRSFHQLMVHGSASGQVNAPLLHALLQTTAANLTDTAFLCTAYSDLSLAVEAVTRACVTLTVLPNLEQQQCCILALASPLLRAAQGCLAAPAPLPSAAPVLRSSLQLLHQILRFGDVSGPTDADGGTWSSSSSAAAPLLPVLQALWPLLRTMLQQFEAVTEADGQLVLLRDEGVCRGAFDLLSSLVSVLSLSALAQADLTQILECVSRGILSALQLKLPAASSALKTATVVVECSSSRGGDGSAALLVADVTAIIQSSLAHCHCQHGGSVPDLRQVLGEDCSCVLEEFFHLVHSCAVFHPDLLLRTAAAGPGPGEAVLSDTLRIASQSLSLCRERDPLRSLLKALQTLFCPGPGPSAAALTYHSCCFGSELVSRLLGLLSEGAVAASLLANIADTLQALITACCISPGPELLSICRGWFAQHLPAHWDRLGSPQQVAQVLVRLGERRDRRLRSMVQDLAKIAAGEIAEDALIAYFDSGG